MRRVGRNPAIAAAFLVAAALVAARSASPPEGAWPSRVERVLDGDTFTVVQGATIRIEGIDAPELDQPGGAASKARLTELLDHNTIYLVYVGVDKYRRLLARVIDENGADIGLKMVRDGHAWQYVQYNNSKVMADAQNEARAARRGLWADRRPTPPWEFRHQSDKP